MLQLITGVFKPIVSKHLRTGYLLVILSLHWNLTTIWLKEKVAKILSYLFSVLTRQRFIFILFVSFISVEIDEKLDLMTPEKYHLLLTSGSMTVLEGTNNDLRDVIDGKELDTAGAWISSENKIDFSNAEIHLPATGRLRRTCSPYYSCKT